MFREISCERRAQEDYGYHTRLTMVPSDCSNIDQYAEECAVTPVTLASEFTKFYDKFRKEFAFSVDNHWSILAKDFSGVTPRWFEHILTVNFDIKHFISTGSNMMKTAIKCDNEEEAVRLQLDKYPEEDLNMLIRDLMTTSTIR
jgi:hypothetical protein